MDTLAGTIKSINHKPQSLYPRLPASCEMAGLLFKEQAMKLSDLPKGTRVYYGGDMANDSGFGTITETISDKWGQFVTIKMDDGRDITHLPVCGFSPEYKGHGGTRSVTIDAYNAYRQSISDIYGFSYKNAV